MTHAQGKRHSRAKLTEEQVQIIMQAEDVTQAELALWYGVSQSTIHRIRSKTSWKYLQQLNRCYPFSSTTIPANES